MWRFVRKERIPAGGWPGFFEGPPDLAVEIVSPSDRLSDVNAKIEQWLGAGTRSVWLVDPPNRSIDVHHQDGQVIRFRGPDVLSDEIVLPGFMLRLDDVFPPR